MEQDKTAGYSTEIILFITTNFKENLPIGSFIPTNLTKKYFTAFNADDYFNFANYLSLVRLLEYRADIIRYAATVLRR